MDHSRSIHGALIAVFVAACILGAGCISQPDGSGAPDETPAPTGEYTFNETDNNADVTLPAGSKITISLAENPTTGYEWNITSSRGLQYVSDVFIPPDTGLVGAGGMHTWQYITPESGTAEFSAIYWRPWAGVTGDETAFKVTFTIK
ncbi:MAG: protease inhibitor I42 family protein [Methanomicrobiales archaeon]|nr:protease inhibitor I42 family protein [Methanomicrobiales archaeon]